ncbi:hypothetical protein D3C79_1106530 [compost metagenome]
MTELRLGQLLAGQGQNAVQPLGRPRHQLVSEGSVEAGAVRAPLQILRLIGGIKQGQCAQL